MLWQPQVPHQAERDDDQEQGGWEGDPECLVWEVGCEGCSGTPILKTRPHTRLNYQLNIDWFSFQHFHLVMFLPHTERPPNARPNVSNTPPSCVPCSSLALLPSRRTYRHGSVVMTSADWDSVRPATFSLSLQTSSSHPPSSTSPFPLPKKQSPPFAKGNLSFQICFPVISFYFNWTNNPPFWREYIPAAQTMDNGVKQAVLGKPLSSGERWYWVLTVWPSSWWQNKVTLRTEEEVCCVYSEAADAESVKILSFIWI